MKIKSFTYTKPNGDVSQRHVMVTVEPTPNVEGIDVTVLTNDDFSEFVLAQRELETRQQAERQKLLQDFDLTRNYRKFSPERMSDVTVEFV